MDSRRFTLFLVLSFALIYLWANLVLPRFAPDPAAQEDQVAQGEGDDLDGDSPVEDDSAGDDDSDEPNPSKPADTPADEQGPDVAQPAAENHPNEDEKPAPQVVAEEFPEQSIILGSDDPDTGYFLKATITSRAAAVERLELSDPRYRKLDNRDEPLPLLTSTESIPELSFATNAIAPLDNRRIGNGQNVSLSSNWELMETVKDSEVEGVNQAVTFRLMSPDGDFEIRKSYRLQRIEAEGSELVEARDSRSDGYQLLLEIEFFNHSDSPVDSNYVLQGPVGTVLENEENARKHRDFLIGVFEDDDSFESTTMTAADVLETIDEEETEFWKEALRYTGIDSQYFSVLIVPKDFQPSDPYTDSVEPTVVDANRDEEVWSDISLVIKSRLRMVEPGQSYRHTYQIYAGPKREVLLFDLAQSRGDQKSDDSETVLVGAEETMNLGWFGFVAKGMLWLLTGLHGIGIPYGIAIIILTIIVRGCLFPLSRKQALSAQKMKELQPKIAELKKKYANDKEKFARAQLDLMSKHNYNPLSGCLPVFMQLPIFIGLYTALSSSVDLRMASFLYVDNLAAPDALVPDAFFGVSLPFIGSDLNLLPLITVGLFMMQQKLFMPPPTDDQQAAQQKMMNFMMIFFGVMFYRVPAGLCVYFMASSLWGIAERKLLDRYKSDDSSTVPATDDVQPATVRPAKQNTTRNGSAGSKKSNKKNRKKKSR